MISLGDWSRGQVLAEQGAGVVLVAVGLVVVLLIFGLIEALVAPSSLPTFISCRHMESPRKSRPCCTWFPSVRRTVTLKRSTTRLTGFQPAKIRRCKLKTKFAQ